MISVGSEVQILPGPPEHQTTDVRRQTTDFFLLSDICLLSSAGGVAQLGEHLLCKQGVVGSIPIVSTIFCFRSWNGFWASRRWGGRTGKQRDRHEDVPSPREGVGTIFVVPSLVPCRCKLARALDENVLWKCESGSGALLGAPSVALV